MLEDKKDITWQLRTLKLTIFLKLDITWNESCHLESLKCKQIKQCVYNLKPFLSSLFKNCFQWRQIWTIDDIFLRVENRVAILEFGNVLMPTIFTLWKEQGVLQWVITTKIMFDFLLLSIRSMDDDISIIWNASIISFNPNRSRCIITPFINTSILTNLKCYIFDRTNIIYSS